jgi:hypothetical protein
MIVNTVYKSRLSAFMVSKPVLHTSLQDLIDDGYEIAMDGSKSNLQLFFGVEDLPLSR